MASLSEHRHYLCDSVRFRAYERALSAVCGSGPVVLDLGAGTGLLGMTALRAGASKVYGVEATGLSDFTAALVEANGLADRYEVIKGRSTEVELPEQVDLVISDQMGGYAVDGDPFPALADAEARHLAPGGLLMPAAVELWATPVCSPRVKDHLDFWSSRPFGYEVTPLREVAIGRPVYTKLDFTQSVATAGLLGRVVTGSTGPSLDLSHEFVIEGGGEVNALAGWFRAELTPGVTISTETGAPDCIDREGVLLPLDPPLVCGNGDVVKVRFRALLDSAMMVWEAQVGEEPTRRHSGWQAFTAAPISRT